jgi:hypothetical protein
VSQNQDKDNPEAYCGSIKHRVEGMRAEAASSLTQIQQTVSPDNEPTPGDDDLPADVAFPITPGLDGQWKTGPQGAHPEGAPHEAASRMVPPPGAARMFGRLDAMDGRQPQHKDDFAFSRIQHGRYLGGYNEVAGYVHAMSGRPAMSRDAYTQATGRPDMHAHYLANYAEGRRRHHGLGDEEYDEMASPASTPVTGARAAEDPEGNRCSKCGHLPGCGCAHHCDNDPQTGGHPQHVSRTSTRHEADAWSQPRQTTDDITPPYNSPATTPPMTQDNGDYQAGLAAGKADRGSGQRPAFADNSSTVSPYVKGYAEGYGAAAPAQGARDVPYSMGGDNGQAANAQEAQRAFQVAKGSRRTSAAFAPAALMRDPEFRKGYLFASRWKPGGRLVSQGSARFEAGLYAGVTDRLGGAREAWRLAHEAGARKHPELGRRMRLHASFTAKMTRRRGLRAQGAYLARTAGTSTDLITDGPGTSPDPMGSTPLNGPGTPPPMAGRDEANAPGGAPPYQGAPPLSGGPVVPDDVMGRPQQQPQPSGPFTNTFSGDHQENVTLAPVAPNAADRPGYSNKDAYQGDPAGGDRVAKLAAFRATVQASITANTHLHPDCTCGKEGRDRDCIVGGACDESCPVHGKGARK